MTQYVWNFSQIFSFLQKSLRHRQKNIQCNKLFVNFFFDSYFYHDKNDILIWSKDLRSIRWLWSLIEILVMNFKSIFCSNKKMYHVAKLFFVESNRKSPTNSSSTRFFEKFNTPFFLTYFSRNFFPFLWDLSTVFFSLSFLCLVSYNSCYHVVCL